MPDFVLSVPLIGQKSGYDGAPLLRPNEDGVPTLHGRMACWYAAACMVSQYFRAGPRNGLPAVWAADAGLTAASIQELAKAEGLRPIPKPAGILTEPAVEGLLRKHGPIWAAGRYLNGSPHAIVLTGVRGAWVLYNDPWEPMAKQASASWLSILMLNIPGALLAKDPGRS